MRQEALLDEPKGRMMLCTKPKTSLTCCKLLINGLLQLVNKLQQTCQFHEVAASLLKSDLLQLVS